MTSVEYSCALESPDKNNKNNAQGECYLYFIKNL